MCGLVADLAGSLKACVDMTVDRVGRETAPVYDKDECPGTFANELRANCHKMVEMAEYMSCCSTLQGGTTKFKVESQPGDNDKSNIVINFARLHHKFQGEPFDFTCRCELANVAILAKFKQNSEVFVEQFGKAIYQEHAMSFMSTCISDIAGDRFRTSVVHESIIKEKPVSDILPFLVVSTHSGPVSLEKPVAFDGTVADKQIIREFSHNLSFQRLTEFVGASMVAEVQLVELCVRGASKTGMPSPLAMLALEVGCIQKDIGMVANILHQEMLMPVSMDMLPSTKSIFGHITFSLAALKDMLMQMDVLLESKIAVAIEASGVQLEPSIGLLRQWRSLMSLFAGRCQTCILEASAQILSKETIKCKETVPAWQACVVDGVLNVALGSKLVAGKLKPVIDMHNSLHQVLTCMSTMATALAISPRLQDHEATCESIALALDCLLRASQGAVVIRGFQVLLDCQTDPKGPQKARAFRDENKVEKNKDIPSAFWDEFDIVASTVAPSASPGSKTKGSPGKMMTTPMKRESSPVSTSASSLQNGKRVCVSGSAPSASSSAPATSAGANSLVARAATAKRLKKL